jgi:hypothetical protein
VPCSELTRCSPERTTARSHSRYLESVWAQPRWNAAARRIMITCGMSDGLSSSTTMRSPPFISPSARALLGMILSRRAPSRRGPVRSFCLLAGPPASMPMVCPNGYPGGLTTRNDPNSTHASGASTPNTDSADGDDQPRPRDTAALAGDALPSADAEDVCQWRSAPRCAATPPRTVEPKGRQGKKSAVQRSALLTLAVQH